MSAVISKKKTASKVSKKERDEKRALEEIELEVSYKWLHWKETFDHFLEVFLINGESNSIAIQRAEEIADKWQAVLERRKPEGLHWYEGDLDD